VTEIPEHLLRRSKEAKSGKSGEAAPAESAGAGGETPAATPATTGGATPAARPAAAAPAEPTPPPVKPDPPYVAAAKARRRVPIWALPVVVFLPIWALSFAGTMQVPEAEDPLFDDAAGLYGTLGCAGCHGAGGGGGVGYALSGGEVLATFPEPIDMMVHVARGSAAIAGEQYGDPNRPGGAHVAGNLGVMPGYPDISLLELELVIYHERHTLSGETGGAAYEEWEERMREHIEAGDTTPIDLDLLLACANPEYTPGATGTDIGGDDCPGPHGE
jgi:hypothetical protein